MRMFETQRLFIGQYRLSDVENYFRLKSCAKVWEYSTFIPSPHIDSPYNRL